jgi:hypothetical protein
VDAGLARATPDTLNQQKIIFILLIVIGAIIGTLAITAIIILLGIVFEKIRHKLRKGRRKERYELIPTYHNVRALRTLEPGFSLSVDTLPPPPPPRPTIPPLDEFNKKPEKTTSTFRA